MSRGAYIQSGNLQEVDGMGSQLSVQISCAVHFPAYNKNLFECEHGVIIPYYMVKYATATNDWSLIVEKHTSEKSMAERYK